MTPAWILDIFAAIMLVVAGISTCRLLVTRPWSGQLPDADIDVAHILMGVAMAGMLATSLQTLPNGLWVAVFAVVTAWFAWRVVAEARSQGGVRGLGAGHHVPHLIHGAAMIYMFVAVTGTAGSAAGAGMSGMGGMSGSMGRLQFPTIGFVFVLLMMGWAVLDLDQLSGAIWHSQPGGRAPAISLPAGLRDRLAVAAGGGATLATAGTAPALPAAALAAPGVAAGPVTDSVGAAESVAAASEPGTEVVAHPAARFLTDERVVIGSRIAMSVTMALMLVLMI
jgi:Domain of unknown function (DUF5134)